jgi:hypothetical protein
VRLRLLMSGMVLAAAALAIAPTSASAAGTPTPVCTGVVQITQFAFTPSAVAPGGTGTAAVTARNCTAVAQQTTAVWTGVFSGATTGLPPGCPVIDPLAQSADFAPYGTYQGQVGYLVFSGCTASRLTVTVRFEQNGAVLAQGSAVLNIIQPVAGG